MRNWAGNVVFGATSVERPTSLDHLQEIVRRSGKARALGSGHSFNRIADTEGTLISLAQMPRRAEIETAARTVTVDGGATYADFATQLDAAGLALGNLASLPHISVAGAVATATHGSGDANCNLASAVSALELVTASGDILQLRRGDTDFPGAVVNLGALGIISSLTLDLVPGFAVRQNVYLDLPLKALLDNFDSVMGHAYSVSLFTRWQGDTIGQVWVKALADAEDTLPLRLGAHAAERNYHPIVELDGADCTQQMGVAGPWYDRLPHFPIGSRASAGAELQSELFVARSDAPAAIRALHAVQAQFSGSVLASEIRSIAADELWQSTAYEQDSIGFHFTWRPEWEPTFAALKAVEAALAPFRPRPHWAKIFAMAPETVRSRYPRFDAFRDLALRVDPQGKFRNRLMDDLLFAE